MSDILRVWELRMSDLTHVGPRQCYLFCNREDAEKYAEHWIIGPVDWIHPKDNDKSYNYAMGVSVEHPHFAFFLRLVQVHKDLKCLIP